MFNISVGWSCRQVPFIFFSVLSFMRRNAIDLFTFVGQFIAQATTALRSEIYLAFMVAVANRRGQRAWAAAPGRSRRWGAKLPRQKYFLTKEHKSEHDKSLLSEPKQAFRDKRSLFLLPACLSISYPTA